MRKIFLPFCMLVLFSTAAVAMDLNGLIEPDEYGFEKDLGRINLFARVEGDELYIAISGETRGWISVGFGSLKMDGAHIVIGYVDGDEVVFAEHLGSGHRHRNSRDKKMSAYGMTEIDGTTSMEVKLPLDEFLDGNRVEMIFAFSRADNLRMIHNYKTSFALDISDL